LCDFPEMLWHEDVKVEKIGKLCNQLSVSPHSKDLISLAFNSEDFVVDLKIPSESIWGILMKKLEFFLDNRPTENIMLCEILRALVC